MLRSLCCSFAELGSYRAPSSSYRQAQFRVGGLGFRVKGLGGLGYSTPQILITPHPLIMTAKVLFPDSAYESMSGCKMQFRITFQAEASGQRVEDVIFRAAEPLKRLNPTWVVVQIMVPFWVP